MVDINKLIQAINLASYEEKQLIVPVEYLVALKNELEYQKNLVETKNKLLKEQQRKIKELTSKLIQQDLKHIDEYF